MNVSQEYVNTVFSEEDEEYDHGEPNDSYGTCGADQLVGHGKITSEKCGTYRGRFGCLNSAGHELPLMLQGEKWHDQIYQKPNFYSCHRPSCPKCVVSWKLREAKAIDYRLTECAKLLGKQTGMVEHFSASISRAHAKRIGFKAERKLIQRALENRGIIGGCMIHHAFRENKATGFWYKSPHWHILGFLEGGYNKCRYCVKQYCSECHGFEWHTKELWKKDGVVVKVCVDKEGVAAERVSVYQTAKYQLSHASIRTDSKRPQVVTWFGIASYRKMHAKYVPPKAKCPICGQRLVRVRQIGGRYLTIDRDSPDFVNGSHEDFHKDGVALWEIEENVKGGGSGSYEQ